MASKENQEALNNFYEATNNISQQIKIIEIWKRNEWFNTLQQAIDDLELKDKALKLFIKDMSGIKVNKDDCFVRYVCTNTDCNECIENRYLTLARKELENGK